MPERGTRGAYRKEDRVQLPAELQKELVEKAAAKFGNCQELAKHLNVPKSSVHYYRIGRLTMPVSILSRMIEIASDELLEARIAATGITKDRMWAIWHAKSVYIESCKEKLRLPSLLELERDDELRRKAAAVISYVLAEGSVWLRKDAPGESAANITLFEQETDLYEHFRELCRDVFFYDIGHPQKPGNDARAIRGFIYSRFIAEWLVENGVPPGDKADVVAGLPNWVVNSNDNKTWVAALQPLCDGEGSVGCSGFSVAQTKHSDLDFDMIPMCQNGIRNKRITGTRYLREKEFCGIRLIDYCSMTARSELLDDAVMLFRRMGLRPKCRLTSLFLKNDGFWSCNWGIFFSRSDAREILRLELVRGRLKRRALELSSYRESKSKRLNS